MAVAGCQSASVSSQTPAAAPQALAFDQAEVLPVAARARDICAEHMPDRLATRAALIAAGIPSQGSEGRFNFFSPDLADMVVALNTSGRAPQCTIAVRRMTPAQARVLIQPWLDVAAAEPTPGKSDRNRTVWSGRFKGGDVALTVVNELNISGFIRGAAIAAIAR